MNYSLRKDWVVILYAGQGKDAEEYESDRLPLDSDCHFRLCIGSTHQQVYSYNGAPTQSVEKIVRHSGDHGLISRPSQTLFFDHLQYAKPEHSVFASNQKPGGGEGLGMRLSSHLSIYLSIYLSS